MGDSFADRVARLRWINERTFEIEGLAFHFEDRPEGADPRSAVVMKSRDFFETYAAELGASPTRRVLEFGIWRGGSALALAALMDVERLVAIDLSPPNEEFDSLRARHPLGGRIAAHYETSQDDAGRVAQIVAAEFDGPVDVIIDDASHLYEETRRTFGHAFRHLRPGGWYVIEDWGWAHCAGWYLNFDKPALTNFVFRLAIVAYSRPDLFDRVVVRPRAVFVQKSMTAPMEGVFDLDDLCEMGGRPPLGLF